MWLQRLCLPLHEAEAVAWLSFPGATCVRRLPLPPGLANNNSLLSSRQCNTSTQHWFPYQDICQRGVLRTKKNGQSQRRCLAMPLLSLGHAQPPRLVRMQHWTLLSMLRGKQHTCTSCPPFLRPVFVPYSGSGGGIDPRWHHFRRHDSQGQHRVGCSQSRGRGLHNSRWPSTKCAFAGTVHARGRRDAHPPCRVDAKPYLRNTSSFIGQTLGTLAGVARGELLLDIERMRAFWDSLVCIRE